MNLGIYVHVYVFMYIFMYVRCISVDRNTIHVDSFHFVLLWWGMHVPSQKKCVSSTHDWGKRMFSGSRGPDSGPLVASSDLQNCINLLSSLLETPRIEHAGFFCAFVVSSICSVPHAVCPSA